MKRLLDYADIFIMASCYLGYLWAAGKFCQRYLKGIEKNSVMFVSFSFCGWALLYMVNRQYVIPNILFLALEEIVFAGMVLLFFRAEWEKKLLAASLLMTVMRLVTNIFVPLLSCLILWFKHTAKRISEPFLSEWEGVLTGCVAFCLVIPAVFWAAKHFASVFYGKPRKWYAVLAVPLLAVIMALDLANWGASHGVMVRSGGNMGLYYDQIFSHAEFCALAVIFLLAAGFYLFGMDRIYLEQKKAQQYQAQVVAYKTLEEQHRRSERLRHDLKNHVIALSGLWENKEWEKLGNYLRKMENSVGAEMHEEATGNRVVDVLLQQKRELAEEKGIVWACDVRIPKSCGIHEFDFCVLFGNILDNAVEACEKIVFEECERASQPFIRVQAGTVKKCFLLEVRNSAGVTDRPKCGQTDKENTQEHGIGLLNVRDVVHGYNGVMNMEIQNGVFAISVLIPLENAVHDIKRTV